MLKIRGQLAYIFPSLNGHYLPTNKVNLGKFLMEGYSLKYFQADPTTKRNWDKQGYDKFSLENVDVYLEKVKKASTPKIQALNPLSCPAST